MPIILYIIICIFIFFVGYLLGISKYKKFGHIEIDENKDLCKFCIDNTNKFNKKSKYALFKVIWNNIEELPFTDIDE